MIERPQLRARLQTAVHDRGLVFVQAPPGYGKSTAIADAMSGARQTIVRYDAAPWDAEAFVEPLVTAMRAARPDFGRRTLALAEAGADPRRIGSTFGADLRHVTEETLIVVEDVHLLGPAFGGFIDGLFRDRPDGVSWLMSSRTAPQFALADLLLRDVAAVFTVDDLRFDRDAIAALAERLELAVASERLDELVRRTEGWPAGVMLSLRTGSAPVAIADGSFEAAGAFLVEQLLRTFADNELATLERVVVFDVIDDRVVDASASARDVRDTLNALEARGAMMSRLANGALRVHPMLRDVILQRVSRRDGAAAVSAMHAGAATFYAGSGRIAAALFHLEAADDAQAIHDVLLQHGTEAIERGHGEHVARLAARLGSSAIADPALVAYLAGWRAKQHGDARARERFDEAERAATASGNGVLAFSARVERIEHDLGRGRTVSQADIDELRTSSAAFGPAARAAAEIRAGWHAAIGGRFDEALASAEDAASLDIPLLRQAAAPLRAYALTALGRFADAEQELAALIERLQDADSLGLRARMLVWSARLALLRGDTRGAYADALEGQRTGSGLIARSETPAMHVAIADAALHAGDWLTADAAITGITETNGTAWYELDRARFPSLGIVYAARSAFLRENAQAALAIIDAKLDDALSVQRAMLLADAAWYARLANAAADDRFRAAIAAIADAVPLDAADAAGINAAVAQLNALAQRSGKLPVSSPALGAFGALTATLAELEQRGPRFESRLIAALESVAVRTPVADAPASTEERLTPRESEILDLLALGLTNKEIAQRLVLGTRTVETHVARILGKLGVNSRSRAIAAHIRKSTDAAEGHGLL